MLSLSESGIGPVGQRSLSKVWCRSQAERASDATGGMPLASDLRLDDPQSHSGSVPRIAVCK